jgi:hypothetical protein
MAVLVWLHASARNTTDATRAICHQMATRHSRPNPANASVTIAT